MAAADPMDTLISTLVTDSFAQYAATSTSLIDYHQRQAYEAQARHDLACAAIEDLLDGPYAPSESALRRALYPDERRVEAIAKARLEGEH